MFKVKYLISITSLSSFIGLLFVLNKTSPMQVGPQGVVVVFILLYLSFLGAVWWFLYFLFFLFGYATKILSPARPFQSVSDRTVFYLASGLSFSPVIIITLRSINTVQIYDYLLVSLFSALIFIYVLKNKT